MAFASWQLHWNSPEYRNAPVPERPERTHRRDLDAYLDHYNYDRAHNGRITQGRIPGDIIDPARKMSGESPT